MFIKDGKSVLSKIELILLLLALILVLLFSYNRYKKSIESFNPPEIPISMQSVSPSPKNVRISIKNATITVNFSVDIQSGSPIPKNIFVILVQYDKNFKNTGNNKFYLSNENEINISVAKNEKIQNICSLQNNDAVCEYTFQNIDVVDPQGNLYYYKIGVSSVYDWGNSTFVTPYNVNSTNKLFTIDSAIEDQNSVYDDFIKFRKMQENINKSSPNASNENLMSSADGQYEFIKSQLGGYPENLMINDTSNMQNSLNDLVGKSMSQGILNINVSS